MRPSRIPPGRLREPTRVETAELMVIGGGPGSGPVGTEPTLPAQPENFKKLIRGGRVQADAV